MADVERINSEFEGRTLTTLTYEGRPCWIAREIGRFLGYSRDGRRLAAKISGGWSEHLLEGHDYAVLQGTELETFRAALLVGDTGTRPSTSHRRLVLLYEPGLHLVLARTSKPVAHRLRHFLIDEVLPHLLPRANASAGVSANASGNAGASASASASASANRGGNANREESAEPGVERAEPGVERVESAERVEPDGGAGGPEAGVVHLHLRPRKVRILDVQLLRERRLIAQHDLRKRMFQAGSLRTTIQTLSQLGILDDGQARMYEVLASEIALGLDADELMVELGHEGLFPPRTVTLEELIQRFNDIDSPVGTSDETKNTTATPAAQ